MSVGASSMGRFEHGGNIYQHQGAIDFSANLNPLGMPEEVERALRENVHRFQAYPDPDCTELVDALSRSLDVPAAAVVCTAGATDLIERVCSVVKPRRALVTAPCFSGYEEALERQGAKVVRHSLREEEDFAVTSSFVRSIDEETDLVFLCTPNNPTGLTVDGQVIEEVCEKARQSGAVVVLDECFLDFTDVPSSVGLCQRFPNLVVMRAFTKIYAMAGLRLGYGICADQLLCQRLRAAGQTWAVSAPAQIAGVAALGSKGFVARSRDEVRRLREDLRAGLEELFAVVVPGEANYLLLKSAVPLYEPLLQRGFLIRRCENYEGLDGQWYRVAVRSQGENDALLAACREVVS